MEVPSGAEIHFLNITAAMHVCTKTVVYIHPIARDVAVAVHLRT